MKKADLISSIAAITGQTKTETAATLSALEQITKQTVQAGGKMVIPGVVTISVSDRAARTGRNPATGEAVQIPAKRVVKAKPPADLSRAA